MNKTPNYFESSYFIHQRYEDTSLMIFQQQQRKKKDLNFATSTKRPLSVEVDPSNHVEFGNYGNRGVVARQEGINHMKMDSSHVQSSVCSIV